MQTIREWWNALRNFMIIVSFVTNFVLLVVVAVVMQQLFTIKNEVAEPLIDGLHSNFVGLEEAEIKTTIPVRDSIFIDFVLPVTVTEEEGGTVVTLVEDVPIGDMPATFSTGPGSNLRGTVSIVLPAGTQLPVTLSLLVPVQQEIPIALDVEVYIPLVQTELAQPFQNLQNLFAPLVNGLNNLPGRWADVPTFTIKTINGEYSGDNNLLRDTEGRQNAWDCSVWNGRECQADELAQQQANTQPSADDTQLTGTNSDNDSSDTGSPQTVPTASPSTTNTGIQPTPTYTPFPQ